jgi:hypothetical protein
MERNRTSHVLLYQQINWRGRPLQTLSVVVNLIAHTTTNKGLHIESTPDRHYYPLGMKVSKTQLESLNLIPDDFHGERNYTISSACGRAHMNRRGTRCFVTVPNLVEF